MMLSNTEIGSGGEITLSEGAANYSLAAVRALGFMGRVVVSSPLNQLCFILENTAKCLYRSVPATQPQVTCLTLGRFLVLFLTAQSPLSAWIKKAALGCCGGRCLHISCALLSSKFAPRKNVKQQGCAVATAWRRLVPSTLWWRELRLPHDSFFSFSRCPPLRGDTVDRRWDGRAARCSCKYRCAGFCLLNAGEIRCPDEVR